MAAGGAPRVIHGHDTEPDGSTPSDWLLASGHWLDYVVGTPADQLSCRIPLKKLVTAS